MHSSFSVFASFLALLPASGVASSFPADYAHQKVYAVTRGPAVFATVSSGIMSKTVIGYKNSGKFAQGYPQSLDSIDAIVTVYCAANDGSQLKKVTTLKLGREWNGTGYMSTPFEAGSLQPADCPYGVYPDLLIAFSDGNNNWDHPDSGDYAYSYSERTGRSEGVVTKNTMENGTEINLSAWSFIIELMRQ